MLFWVDVSSTVISTTMSDGKIQLAIWTESIVFSKSTLLYNRPHLRIFWFVLLQSLSNFARNAWWLCLHLTLSRSLVVRFHHVQIVQKSNNVNSIVWNDNVNPNGNAMPWHCNAHREGVMRKSRKFFHCLKNIHLTSKKWWRFETKPGLIAETQHTKSRPDNTYHWALFPIPVISPRSTTNYTLRFVSRIDNASHVYVFGMQSTSV